jgi:hypothetical protein
VRRARGGGGPGGVTTSHITRAQRPPSLLLLRLCSCGISKLQEHSTKGGGGVIQ